MKHLIDIIDLSVAEIDEMIRLAGRHHRAAGGVLGKMQS